MHDAERSGATRTPRALYYCPRTRQRTNGFRDVVTPAPLDLLSNALGKPGPYSSCLSPRNRCRREVRSFGEARHCGEVEISPRFPSQLWTLAYFHAYLGYEFTHKLGIETDPVRIIGVSFPHNRGTRLPYPIAEKRFAPSPVLPVANPYIYQPVVSARKVEIAPDSPTDQRGPVKSENLRPVGERRTPCLR